MDPHEDSGGRGGVLSPPESEAPDEGEEWYLEESGDTDPDPRPRGVSGTTLKVTHEEGSAPSESVEVRSKLRVRGETFFVVIDDEDDSIHVVHPRWSLAGVGVSLSDAMLDLFAEARDLAGLLAPGSVGDLGTEALALRDFVLPYLTMDIPQ